MRCSAVRRCGAVLCGVLRCGAVRWGAVRCGVARRDALLPKVRCRVADATKLRASRGEETPRGDGRLQELGAAVASINLF